MIDLRGATAIVTGGSRGTNDAVAGMSRTALEFIYLSEPDMVAAGVLDMAACVDTMTEMFALLGRGDYRMAGKNGGSHGAMVSFPPSSPFPRMPLDGEDRRFMAMPAYLGGDFHAAGVKWYGSNIDNKRAGLPRSIHVFVLNDAETGAPTAIMSANLLSAMRTGAVPGVGAALFAPDDATTVGIVGPGVMAKTSLRSFLVARPGLRRVRIKGRSTRGVAAFAQWAAQELPQLRVEAVDSNEEAVRDADIVTYCTTAATTPDGYPELRREWLRPGAYVSLPSCAKVDEAMYGDGVRKVVDHLGLYEAWAEEFPYPTYAEIPIIGCEFTDRVHEGRLRLDEIEDLGALLASDRPPRHGGDEITLFSIGGMPVEDVAWAARVVARARGLGLGTRLDLWQTPMLV